MHHALLFLAHSIESSTLPSLYKVPSSTVTHIVGDTFTIAEARSLKSAIFVRPQEGDLAVFVIAVRTIASEAQQALLKILEEPPAHSRLYIVVPQLDVLLPTVRSRLQLENTGTHSIESGTVFSEFLELSIVQKMQVVADKVQSGDIAWIEQILAGAEQYAMSDIGRFRELAGEVVMVRQYIGRKGSSKKMLLESLVCSLF
jgi:hypothetical protein